MLPLQMLTADIKSQIRPTAEASLHPRLLDRNQSEECVKGNGGISFRKNCWEVRLLEGNAAFYGNKPPNSNLAAELQG